MLRVLLMSAATDLERLRLRVQEVVERLETLSNAMDGTGRESTFGLRVYDCAQTLRAGCPPFQTWEARNDFTKGLHRHVKRASDDGAS